VMCTSKQAQFKWPLIDEHSRMKEKAPGIGGD